MNKISKKTGKKDQKIGQILGINIISTSTEEVLTRVNQYLSHNVKFYIVTPNPELVLMAQDNFDLKAALNASLLPIPDGVGLFYAFRWLYGKSLNIIPGRKLFMQLISFCSKDNRTVFLLGGQNGEAGLAAEELKKTYKNLKILSDQGPELNTKGEPVTEIDRKRQKDAIDKINKFAPDLLFLAFGNPKQEIWIHKNISDLKIGGAMTVGGTFRYVAGMSKLPPDWVEKAGLEWLWRLLTEPVRFRRVINASVIFPWRVFRSRI